MQSKAKYTTCTRCYAVEIVREVSKMIMRLLSMEERTNRAGNIYYIGDILVNNDKLSYFYDTTDGLFNLFRGSKQDKLLPDWTPIRDFVVSTVEK